jgi:hypothetical protein
MSHDFFLWNTDVIHKQYQKDTSTRIPYHFIFWKLENPLESYNILSFAKFNCHFSNWWDFVPTIYNYLCNQCLSSLMLWVRISIGARCTTLCDKVCQWLAIGRWYSPISSPNKTDRHDISNINKIHRQGFHVILFFGNRRTFRKLQHFEFSKI